MKKQPFHERLLGGKSFLELGMARSEVDKSVLVVDGLYTEDNKLSPAMDNGPDRWYPEGGTSQLEDDTAEGGKSTPVADTSTPADGKLSPAADTPHSADDTQQVEELYNRHRPTVVYTGLALRACSSLG